MSEARRTSATGVEAARTALSSAHPSEVVRWALGRFGVNQTIVLTSLQSGGVAVADMALRADARARIVTIDTGRLPRLTHSYLDQLRERWRHPIEVVVPDQMALGHFLAEQGSDPFFRSIELRQQCCGLRKVAPLDRLLKSVDCWMTGLRREQGGGRESVELVELDPAHGGIVKVNPLAAWSHDQVRSYLKDRELPEHPLYGLGYRSIGCEPCTRAVRAEEPDRAGRWWWETAEHGGRKECGLHAYPQAAVGTST